MAIVMAAVTLGAAVLVYVALAVAWRVRDRVDRAAAAVLPSIEIDPYHARATAGSPADMDEAAAASLLLADRVTVDEQGLLSPAGHHEEPPAHPVEAVLMDALHRGERPLALRRLRSFTGADERTAAFLREQDARVPRWADRDGDALIRRPGNKQRETNGKGDLRCMGRAWVAVTSPKVASR